MAFRVDISPQALADLNAFYLRIRQDAPENADRWLIGITDAIYSLEDMPSRCMIAEESKDLAGRSATAALRAKESCL